MRGRHTEGGCPAHRWFIPSVLCCARRLPTLALPKQHRRRQQRVCLRRPRSTESQRRLAAAPAGRCGGCPHITLSLPRSGLLLRLVHHHVAGRMLHAVLCRGCGSGAGGPRLSQERLGSEGEGGLPRQQKQHCRQGKQDIARAAAGAGPASQPAAGAQQAPAAARRSSPLMLPRPKRLRAAFLAPLMPRLPRTSMSACGSTKAGWHRRADNPRQLRTGQSGHKAALLPSQGR